MTNIKKGFTLIEILVVISIIGILSVVIMTSLNKTKEKGLAIKSTTELTELKKALELYKSDKGEYPGETAGDYYCVDPKQEGQLNIISFFDNELIQKKYITAIPYYVTYNNDFFYTTNKEYLQNNTCGNQNFKSYMIGFKSDQVLQLSKLGNEDSYYCLGI